MLFFISKSFADQNKQQIPVYTDSSQSITITPNSPEFKIQLKANPTTGYTWNTKKYDQNLLTLVNYRYLSPHIQMPGAGGISEWDFKAKAAFFVKSQSTEINLLYARPWDLSDNPTNLQFTVMSKIN